MSFWSWLTGVMQPSLFKTRARLLILGIDGAGKTTLMRRLGDDHGRLYSVATPPRPVEKIRIGNVEYATFDLGGH